MTNQHVVHRLKEIIDSMELTNEYLHNFKSELPGKDTIMLNIPYSANCDATSSLKRLISTKESR